MNAKASSVQLMSVQIRSDKILYGRGLKYSNFRILATESSND